MSWEIVGRLLEGGLVARRDLSIAGVHPRWLHRQVATERLICVHPGVLRLPDLKMDLDARFRAALLQAGPDAALSHTSALEIYGLLEELTTERLGFRYRVRDVMEVHPVLTQPDMPVPRAVSAGIRRVLGREAQFICSPGTYDQKHVARIGHLHDCVAYGPGILDLAHQPDEFVVIDDLVASAQVMALATLELLGVRP